VTHDESIAARADRIVEMLDGRLARDAVPAVAWLQLARG
jgi:ABC-type lipoprotein export system ATPase subunit